MEIVLNKLFIVISGFLNLFLAIFVFSSFKQKSRLIIFYIFNTLCLSFWMFDIASLQIASNLETALFLRKIFRFGTLLIPFSFYLFLSELVKNNSKINRIAKFVFGSVASSIYILRVINLPEEKYIFTNMFIPVPDIIMFLHIINTLLALICGVLLIVNYYRKERKIDPSRTILVTYVVFSILIVTILGALSFLIMYFSDFKINIILNSGTVMFTGITAYALVKNELFDLKLIVTRAFAFFVTWLLLITPLITSFALTNSKMMHVIVSSSSFFLALIFGDYLVKKIQTNRAQKWISDWYDLGDFTIRFSEALAPVLDPVELFKTIRNELRIIMKVPHVYCFLAERNAPQNDNVLFYKHLFQSPTKTDLEKEAKENPYYNPEEPLIPVNIGSDSALTKMLLEKRKFMKDKEIDKSILGELLSFGIKDTKIIIPMCTNGDLEGFVILGPKKSQAPYYSVHKVVDK
ncbi:MAG: hypothetical protein GY730_04985 [bacterium]|nr:hypothetical protein [bacterium]